MANSYEGASDVLGGATKGKPAKELHEVRTRKVKGHGGKTSYIHEHHFTHPEHHKPEEHTSGNQDEMVDHMMQNMGEPNPGESQANAGDAGTPAPQAAPQAAPGGMPGM